MNGTPKQQRSSAGKLLRRVIRWPRGRKWLLGAAASVIAAVDETTPAYQPVDVLGIAVDRTTQRRMESRWEAIAPVLERVAARSALDVGAAEGFYSLRMAQSGMPVVALEAKERPYRVLQRAASIIAPPGQLAQLRMTVSPETIELLPRADAVLLLAVWHHWIRNFGLAQADRMLTVTWERSKKVLFFETGENMPAAYGLPDFGTDPLPAIAERLERACPDSRVEFLGRHPERHLFAIIRR